MKRTLIKKRTESSLVTACLKYLQCLENMDQIVHADRLNSGRIALQRHDRWQNIRLCRSGTPDMFIVLKNGDIVWVEAKLKGESGLTEEQKQFRSKIRWLKNHDFLVISELDHLVFYLKNGGIENGKK